ncbi:FmdB family transcriptional regulator [archaeon]|nr:FmdB family transcriptional regulator [archaeon]|tara:strand:+ start:343 stop:564 length:222 start_codon:yes stop_codon:yes gene_type:complete
MMPLYTFQCPSCRQEQEVKQSISDPIPLCKRCKSASLGIHVPKMIRIFKPTGKPKFKGTGFYETDYAKKGKKT